MGTENVKMLVRDMRKRTAAITAAEWADWGQVVANGGPPCFYIQGNGHFCLRAKPWQGHGEADHAYVSLADLLRPTPR